MEKSVNVYPSCVRGKDGRLSGGMPEGPRIEVSPEEFAKIKLSKQFGSLKECIASISRKEIPSSDVDS
jgi:hypothetical protein